MQNCSCCPPNLVRLIPAIADFIYTYDEQYLYVHQYIANKGLADGHPISIETNYPVDGKIRIVYSGEKNLSLRRPAWCSEMKTSCSYQEKNGYLYFETNEVEVEFVMKPVFYVSSDKVHDNTGRVALMRGPIVYCIEEQAQEYPIFQTKVDTSVPVTVSEECYGGYPVLYGQGIYTAEQNQLYAPIAEKETRPCKLKFIPYYAFANRGEDNMQVWIMGV